MRVEKSMQSARARGDRAFASSKLCVSVHSVQSFGFEGFILIRNLIFLPAKAEALFGLRARIIANGGTILEAKWT